MATNMRMVSGGQRLLSNSRFLDSRSFCRQAAASRRPMVVQAAVAAPAEAPAKVTADSSGAASGSVQGSTAAPAAAPPPATAASHAHAQVARKQQIKVRFAPSPTGNLHVGGARTALFNWLYARKTGGQFVLRIEDTDTSRSTRESENAMKDDLKWLGLDWDEGPDVGGGAEPYRQSERASIYKAQVDRLVAEGRAYPCFCSDAELEAMKADAEAKKLPPIYRGKWSSASKEEVEAEMAKGTPFCYRFRVPSNKELTINDIVRGKVTWNTDSLGDFVVLRSNGLPVYNFCVAIDDALMGITHVLRAEEHLPNTLRQLLVYDALGFTPPAFGHMSLILAPDKSKLSKRHGATSVGDFKAQGYLASAMVNYLSLLGWNDGSEKEIYTVEELTQAFSLDRITKSAAVFDKVKLNWMNGQHLRLLPESELISLIGKTLVDAGLLSKADSPFAAAVAGLMKGSVDVLSEASQQLPPLLSYPLSDTSASEEFKPIVEDNFAEVAAAVLAAYDSGDLAKAVEAEGGFKKWANALGKAQKRKGKRLFMPLRIALTGRMAGPDVGELLAALAHESGSDVVDRSSFVALPQRMEGLRAWLSSNPASSTAAASS